MWRGGSGGCCCVGYYSEAGRKRVYYGIRMDGVHLYLHTIGGKHVKSI